MANRSEHRQSSLSSDKLLAILECLASNRMPVRLQDLSEQSGITQSTVLRYLRTLQNTGYVYQDEETLRYALTWKLCSLTENLNSFAGLRNIASPIVNRLAGTLHLGVCLVVPKDHHTMYLDCIDYPGAQYNTEYIGKQAPLHTVACGKLFLSTYSPAQLDVYIEKVGLQKLTPNTITDRDQLVEMLEQVRRQGYGEDKEECEEGLACVGYPLYNYKGEICAGISYFGDAYEMRDPERLKAVHRELQGASREISRRLGWIGPDSTPEQD